MADVPEEEWRDWAGLPEDLLVKVAGTLVAQNEAGWAAQLKEWGNSAEEIQERMAERERDLPRGRPFLVVQVSSSTD